MTAQYPPVADVLRSVREFIDEIRPSLAIEQRFHARVASYLLDIVVREILANAPSGASPFHLDDPECFRTALASGDFDCREQELISALLERSECDAAIVRPQHVETFNAQEPEP